MTSVRPITQVARWLTLLGFVVAGLYFLNDALSSAWLTGGPPSDHKLGWERRSQASLALCFASLVAGCALFRAITRYPAVGRSSWVLGVLAVALAVTPFAVRQVLIDKCLDSGGRWSKLAIECEH
jgi:hypothetical protein